MPMPSGMAFIQWKTGDENRGPTGRYLPFIQCSNHRPSFYPPTASIAF
jgi:hypothetical protein